MNIYDLIVQRRTIRRFQQRELSKELLRKMVNAGRLAPSAANLQPLEFLVVDEPKLVDSVFATLKWAGYIAPAGDPPEGARPVAYIVVLINSEIRPQHGEVDAAAAIENMILTALGEGVGSCWLGAIDRDQIRALFKIPEQYQINAVLALGYPAESPVIEEMVDSIKYWKDEQGTLHVPKRKISQIIHFNQF
ncbi:MAG: nitroreductase family protein [candidate division KSB1 bacterium]|nr:nitroreductase family protein [candidate division KSB1 bacterium]